MFGRHDLVFHLLIYISSIAAAVIFVLTGIRTAVELLKNKKIACKAVKFSVSALCLAWLYLSLPWWFIVLASDQKIPQKEAFYYKLAANTAVIPSVKSSIYSWLGRLYYINDNGPDALIYNRKAVELDNSYELCDADNPDRNRQCKDHIWGSLYNLCDLYTVKGDVQNGVKVCNLIGLPNYAAINHILKDDYQKALDTINERIVHRRHGSQIYCTNYALRAYIYERLNKPKESKEDYDKASKLCTNPKHFNNLKHNKNFYKDLFAKRKIQYGF